MDPQGNRGEEAERSAGTDPPRPRAWLGPSARSGKPPQMSWGVASIAFELVGVVGVGSVIGYGVDRWMGWSPWGLLTGALIGIVGGLYTLIREAWRMASGQNRQNQRGAEDRRYRTDR